MTDKAKPDRGQKRPEKAKNELPAFTVLVDGKVCDGAGGYFKKGDRIEPVDPDGLRARGFVG